MTTTRPERLKGAKGDEAKSCSFKSQPLVALPHLICPSFAHLCPYFIPLLYIFRPTIDPLSSLKCPSFIRLSSLSHYVIENRIDPGALFLGVSLIFQQQDKYLYFVIILHFCKLPKTKIYTSQHGDEETDENYEELSDNEEDGDGDDDDREGDADDVDDGDAAGDDDDGDDDDGREGMRTAGSSSVFFRPCSCLKFESRPPHHTAALILSTLLSTSMHLE